MKIGGLIPWNATPICETLQISYLMERRPMKDVFENLFGGKVLPGLFLGYALHAGGIWKGDVLVAEIEELETMDASKIYSKRLNAKEVIFPKENGNFIFPVADGRIKLSGGDQDLRTPTLIREHPIEEKVRIHQGRRIPWNATAIGETFKISRLMGGHPMKGGSEYHLTAQYSKNLWRRSGSENIHLNPGQDSPDRGEEQDNLRGELDGSSSTSRQDSSWYDGDAENDFWSLSGDFIYRRHVEPRVKLHSPREESFPIPLKYIDVSRTTRMNSDVMQERRIDDCWNIDESRDSSDSRTGFTQFTLSEEKPPDAQMRPTKRQVTSRPDHLWPELWTKLGRNAKLKEKQKWSNEKP